MTAKETPVEKPAQIIPMLRTDFISVIILGAIIGLFIWGFGAALNRFVFEEYFCQGDISSQCGSAKSFSVAAASLVGGIAALTGLIRLRVFRPLLVLIASLVSTWGVVQTSWDLGRFTGIVAVIVLYALAFGVFAWIARIREFWIALVAMIVLVVAVRLALTL